MTKTEAAFVGWLRGSRRDPWRRVAEADTEAACWDALGDYAIEHGIQFSDQQVTRRGQQPIGAIDTQECFVT